MNSHSATWLAVALATVLIPGGSALTLTQFALLAAAAYLAAGIVRRNPLARRAKRITTAAKAVRRAL
jgi:hypothetical protein